MSASRNLYLIYDGQCVFCRRTLNLFRGVDVLRRLRLVDANDKAKVLEKFPMLSNVDTDQAMYAVDAKQDVFRGFFAFRRLVWNSPFTWPLLLLFYFPCAAFFGVHIYAWIAKNRTQMGCKSDVCHLPGASGKSNTVKKTGAP